ncbi:MAG: VacB/RNase II family 3'-5' exoribonuclease, partial [Thermoanaerobaculia bacterium]|nr:VacB/RNase II family 3'-5' exoribonuclease [Thermoanaerobaculia bacterium]
MSNELPGHSETEKRRLFEALEGRGKKGAQVGELVETSGTDLEPADVAELLRELEREGEAVEWNGRWYALRFTRWVVGRVEILRGGRALGRTGTEEEAGYFIPKGDLNGARDGDLVLLKPRKKKGKQHGLPPASVAKILERRFRRVVGRAVPWHGGFRLEPFDPRTNLDVDLRGSLPKEGKPGDYVVAELLDQPGRRGHLAARVTELLGDDDAPGVDMEVVLAHYEIPDEFPGQVLEAVEGAPEDPGPDDLAGRRDLSRDTIVTIDGESARDFDDAISVEETDRGFRLGVHIADVSHYVAEGSALDREAYRRGTSVYFPERAVPMLPEVLSNGLCSLRPDVPRLTVSVFLDIDRDGEVVKRRFAKSWIKSHRRMTYREVARLLEEPQPGDEEEYGDVLAMLGRAQKLMRKLLDRRLAAGSLDFDLPEVDLQLDARGRVVEIHPAERTVAHRIIEEFMITANRAAARELDSHEMPALHRVHPPPDESTLEETKAALAAIGYTLASYQGGVNPEIFQRVLSQAHGGDRESLVSTLVLRAMQRAVYSAEGTGHFALSLGDYAHFTSPIRRYPDLIVHRQLKRILDGRRDDADLRRRLPAMAEHTRTTARRAESAERELVKWKK